MKRLPILVLSDLHLGEDLRPALKDSTHFEHLATDLAEMLHYYTQHRVDSKPWRLLLNGDIIDFLSVRVDPADLGTITGFSDDEHSWGIQHGPRAAAAKTRIVIERNATVFRALALFVAAGNCLSIVPGNHDMEFHWPEVQAVFRFGLIGYWDSETRLHTDEEDTTFLNRVQFHPWFFLQEGLLYAEHGHQYDRYCSVDTMLSPADPVQGHLNENVGIAIMRYVGNQLPEAPEANQNLGFFDSLAVLFKKDRGLGLSLLSGYFTMVRQLLFQWFNRQQYHDLYAKHALVHQRRLRGLARSLHLPEETIFRLFRLRKRPIFLGLSSLIRAIMLGRLILLTCAVLAFPLLLLFVPFKWLPVCFILTFLLTALANKVLSDTTENPNPSIAMESAAQEIHQLFQVPFVVMGHSHKPLIHRLHRGWYFNTGTWVGGDKALQNYTHLVITPSDSGGHAELLQWRDGRPWELRSERSP